MAYKTKTTPTQVNVNDFIESFVDHEQKKIDSYKLIELLREWSGYEPYMWGPTIISFGTYHYKYESGHEGDAPVLGFSPRKTDISLYVYCDTVDNKKLLKDLGKYRMGKACIWVKKLSDIDIPTLKKMCKASIAFHTKK